MTETLRDNLKAVIVNDLTEIGRLSEVIEAFIARNGLDRKAAFEINLALDELLTNTISYGYDDGQEHRIGIEVAFVEGVITIEVEDDGRAFNPFEAREPDLDADLLERPIGGLGVHLVRQVIDQVDYRRTDGRNIVTLKKHV